MASAEVEVTKAAGPIENVVVDDDRSLGVRRSLTIPGKDKPAFEQKDVEFPKFWSQTATNIVAQKYFRGRLGSPERESSVKQMISRVVDTITAWGEKQGYFAA